MLARYLAGMPVERVTALDVDPWVLSARIRPGSARQGAPARQRFWAAAAGGATHASVDWRMRDGEYSLVVMNADGTRGVRASGRLAVTMPRLAPFSVVGVAIGLALLAGGIAAPVAGARSRPRRDPMSRPSTSHVRSSR